MRLASSPAARMAPSRARPVAVAARVRAATRALVIAVIARARATARALGVVAVRFPALTAAPATARLPAVTAAPTVVQPVGGISGRAAPGRAAATRAPGRAARIIVVAGFLALCAVAP